MNGISKYDQPGHRFDVPDVAVESNERVAGIGGLFLYVCVCVCVCVCECVCAHMVGGWVWVCANIYCCTQTVHPSMLAETTFIASRHSTEHII